MKHVGSQSSASDQTCLGHGDAGHTLRHDGFIVAFHVFASFGAFWGLFWLLVACLAYVLGGSLLVGRFRGMSTVKVHEWCLVCYGWLDVCLRSNVHACIPLQLCVKACIVLSILWVSCVAYLIDGIVWVNRRPFSSCVAHAAWDEPRSDFCDPPCWCQCIDDAAHEASFGILYMEPDVGKGLTRSNICPR